MAVRQGLRLADQNTKMQLLCTKACIQQEPVVNSLSLFQVFAILICFGMPVRSS
jgi:hypothetical protein